MDSNDGSRKIFSEEYIVIDDIVIEKTLMDEVEKRVNEKRTVYKNELDS